MSKKNDAPKVSPRILGWFRWYTRRYLRKAFHSVSVAVDRELDAPIDAPLIVYLNHASWWDPLIAMHLAEVATPGRTLYAPFDEEALARYPIFQKLGFFGVDQSSRRGAAQFLRTARDVLERPGGSLWMTPEGRFTDPRDRPPFQPGLAHLVEHLASTGSEAVVAPLAIEYAFWEEKLPEALCRWGEPIRVAEHAGLSKEAWGERLEAALRDAQHDLAAMSVARDAAAFRVLLGGAAGVGGLYEAVRRLVARHDGVEYRASHGEKLVSRESGVGSR